MVCGVVEMKFIISSASFSFLVAPRRCSSSSFVITKAPLVVSTTSCRAFGGGARRDSFPRGSFPYYSSFHRRHQNQAILSSSSSSSSNATFTSTRNMSSSSSSSTSSKLYWNREEWKPKSYKVDAPIIQEARILSLSNSSDTSNSRLHNEKLPEGSKLLKVGSCLEDFGDIKSLKQQTEPNVLFVSHPKSKQPLVDILQAFPSIKWIHCRSAGIDFVSSDQLSEVVTSRNDTLTITNAKGTFSSTLSEYTMMACSYFAKDLPRLLKQQKDANWERYCILELRGATLGIVGYGDIGHATAKLAKAYGMKIIALRRNPNTDDPYCDVVYGSDKESLNRIFKESDYILCSAPLTTQTKGMIGKEQFDCCDGHQVFINVGRGPIVNEQDMIDALKDGRLKGAGLDVTTIEPLPKESELWKLKNVLLSPHNMDATETFMEEATDFFIDENLPRFLRGETLLNPVDAVAGY